jgi:hypothetical protein
MYRVAQRVPVRKLSLQTIFVYTLQRLTDEKQ